MIASVAPVLAQARNADVSINVAENVGFGLIALVMVVAALRVVTTRNVVHAALWLVLVLAGAAAQFLLLAAEFVAVTQVLVYIGAIVVLFLFGIMLTKSRMGETDLSGRNWAAGLFTALLLVLVVSVAQLDAFGGDRLPAERELTGDRGLTQAFVADTGITQPGRVAAPELVDRVEGLEGISDAERSELTETARIVASGGNANSNTAAVSDAIFSTYLIPFEAVSVLLTAALIGAIVIARRD